MPESTVENTIAAMKAAHGAETDEQLAKSLGIGRSTISSWRIRGSVPQRYLTRVPGDSRASVSYAPLSWEDEERAAFELALLRFFKEHGKIFENYRAFLEGGMAVAGFWIILDRAKKDIVTAMDEGDKSALRAAHILAFREFAAPE